uniref:STAS domain-containing protein n=1 Tax=Dendroctonus ponderosae TaxID=77166 RepID=A0AAR5PYM6_DENPD
MSAINVDEVDGEVVKNLINSVDTVLFDIDGVLVIQNQIVPGAAEFIEKLRNIGKKIAYVTNNTLKSPETIKQILAPIKAELDEINNPITALLEYLQRIDYKKDIYVIGSRACKKLLTDAGFNVIDYKSLRIRDLEEDLNAIRELSRKAIERCQNVGMVFLDYDINFCQGAIQVAQVILSNIANVQLASGCLDDWGNIGSNIILSGPKYYGDALERWSEKKTIGFGKPGQGLVNLIYNKLNITDGQRALMIGDRKLITFHSNFNMPMKKY